MDSFQKYLDCALPEVRFDEACEEPSIFEALVRARKLVGMTQCQLSKVSGVPQSFICLIENGKANPSIKVLQRLAKGLGMTLRIVFE